MKIVNKMMSVGDTDNYVWNGCKGDMFEIIFELCLEMQ